MPAKPTPKPRIPRRSPVVVTHLCADNDYNGNPRRCFIIRDTQNRLVEVLDEGYNGEGVLSARYPWTNWHTLRNWIAEPAEYTSYPARVNVPPAEYKRALRMEADERTAPLLRQADRCQAWMRGTRS